MRFESSWENPCVLSRQRAVYFYVRHCPTRIVDRRQIGKREPKEAGQETGRVWRVGGSLRASSRGRCCRRQRDDERIAGHHATVSTIVCPCGTPLIPPFSPRRGGRRSTLRQAEMPRSLAIQNSCPASKRNPSWAAWRVQALQNECTPEAPCAGGKKVPVIPSLPA